MGSGILRFKIGAAIVGVVVLALLVTATLSFLVYERTLAGLLLSRFELVAGELRREIEASLDLGLPLGELDNVALLLAARKASDPQITGITIVDGRGTVLFDTDPAAIGRPVGAAVLAAVEAQPRAGDAAAAAHGPGASDGPVEPFTVARPVVTSFGKLAGGVIIRYNSAYQKAKREAMLGRLGLLLALALASSAFVALAGILMLTERLAYVHTRLETSVRLMLRRIGRPLPDDDLPPELAHSFLALERDLDTTIARLVDGRAPAAAARP
jgi:hypothetical protein